MCVCLCKLQEVLGQCNLQPTTADGPGVPDYSNRWNDGKFMYLDDFPGFQNYQLPHRFRFRRWFGRRLQSMG